MIQSAAKAALFCLEGGAERGAVARRGRRGAVGPRGLAVGAEALRERRGGRDLTRASSRVRPCSKNAIPF